MTARARNRLIAAAKLAVAVALVAWLVQSGRLDLGAYTRLDAGIAPWLLAGIFVAQALSLTTFIARWHGLAHVQGLLLRWREVIGTGAQGLFLQLFVPGGLGADGLRLLLLQQHHRSKLARGVASLIADRLSGVVGVFVLAVMAIAALAATGRGDALVAVMLPILGVLALAAPIFLLLLRLPDLAARLPGRMGPALDAVRRGLAAYAGHPRALSLAVGISVLSNLWSCVAAWLGLRLLGIESPPLVGVVAITCALNVVRMIPISPLGLGVTDLAAEQLYGLLDIGSGAELQMLQRVVSMTVFAVSGLAFMWQVAPARPGDAQPLAGAAMPSSDIIQATGPRDLALPDKEVAP